MPTVLVTGASRGIGLEFARQYAAQGWRVFAGCRRPETARDLAALGNGGISVHALDVDDPDSIAACAGELGAEPIDLLINNAGINNFRDQGLGSIDYAGWEATFRTNVIGPYRVAEAFAEALAAGDEPKLITISSRMGSIGELKAHSAVIYRTSKAAVNMATKSLGLQLAGRGITAIAFHPGWVRTDMGGASAAVSPQDSVAGMRQVIAGLGPADNGKFYQYDGVELPW